MAVALPFIAMGAMAGGSVLAGVAAGNAANYQAAVARQNATIAQQNAQRAAMATSSQVTQAGLKARAQSAAVRDAAAANNLDVNSGSAGDIQTSQKELGALDVANTAERGAAATYGYETQASSFEAEASLKSSEAPYDYAGGILKGAGSLLSAAPNVPGAYSWMTGGGGGVDASGLGSMVQPDGWNGLPNGGADILDS